MTNQTKRHKKSWLVVDTIKADSNDFPWQRTHPLQCISDSCVTFTTVIPKPSLCPSAADPCSRSQPQSPTHSRSIKTCNNSLSQSTLNHAQTFFFSCPSKTFKVPKSYFRLGNTIFSMYNFIPYAISTHLFPHWQWFIWCFGIRHLVWSIFILRVKHISN